MDIRTHALTKIGHLVDIGDLDSQKGVARIFDQLARFETGHQDWCFYEIEWTIELAENVARAIALGTDNNPVRTHEIRNGCTLAQEFGI